MKDSSLRMSKQGQKRFRDPYDMYVAICAVEEYKAGRGTERNIGTVYEGWSTVSCRVSKVSVRVS